MAAKKRFMRQLIVVASLALVAASVGAANANEGRVLELLVITAVTPEEHAEAATFYADKARVARGEAVRHREMGTRYTDGGMSGLEQRQALTAHCEKIASLHTEMAEEYEALARIHNERARRLEAEANP